MKSYQEFLTEFTDTNGEFGGGGDGPHPASHALPLSKGWKHTGEWLAKGNHRYMKTFPGSSLRAGHKIYVTAKSGGWLHRTRTGSAGEGLDTKDLGEHLDRIEQVEKEHGAR